MSARPARPGTVIGANFALVAIRGEQFMYISETARSVLSEQRLMNWFMGRGQ